MSRPGRQPVTFRRRRNFLTALVFYGVFVVAVFFSILFLSVLSLAGRS